MNDDVQIASAAGLTSDAVQGAIVTSN